MKSFKRYAVLLMLLSFIFSTVSPALAEGKPIVIHEGGSVTYDGGSAADYTNGSYKGVDKAIDMGSSVSSITTEGVVTGYGNLGTPGVVGIRAANMVKTNSITDGIDVKANSGAVTAIFQQTGVSDMDLKGIGDINVGATGNGQATGITILSGTNSANDKLNIEAKSLSASSEENSSRGIYGSFRTRTSNVTIQEDVTVTGAKNSYGTNTGNGTTEDRGSLTLNIGGNLNVFTNASGARAYGIHSGEQNVMNVIVGKDINATSLLDSARAIQVSQTNLNVSAKNIYAISKTNAYGAYGDTSELDVTTDKLTVTSTEGKALGVQIGDETSSFTGDIKELSVTGATSTMAIDNTGGTVSGKFGNISAAGTSGDVTAVNTDGGSVAFEGSTNISAQGNTAADGRVKGIMINNGGIVKNSEGDSLTVTAANTGTAANSRADGIVLWDNSLNKKTKADLYGVTGVTATGYDAHGVDVWEDSEATIRGNGNAKISASANGNKGEAYAVQLGDTGDAKLTLQGFKTIEASSAHGYARTINGVGGELTVNDVEIITAYGGLTPVDPDYAGEYGLAYAVQAAGGNITLNGNNTAISAVTESNRAVGIAAGWGSEVNADGITSITTQVSDTAEPGNYVSANGIEADGISHVSTLLLNQKEGSPYADITTTANSARAYGVYAQNGGIVKANVNKVTVTGGLDAVAVNSIDEDSEITINGNGTTSAISANSAEGNAYGLVAQNGGTLTANNVASISANGVDAAAIYAYQGQVAVNGDTSTDGTNKTTINGDIYSENAGSVSLDKTNVNGQALIDATSAVTLNNSEVANNIYNAGTVEAKNGNTFASGIENNNVFNVTGAGNVTTNFTGTGTVNIQNDGELTNGGELTQLQVNVAAGGELSTGIINGNLENSGTVNLASGTVTDTILENYTNVGDAKLNLTDKAVYDTTSGKVFTNALTDFIGNIKSKEDRNAYVAANNYGTNSLAASKLTYVGGQIELNDSYYTLDYAKLAKKTLEEAGSGSTLVMNGIFVAEVKEDGSQTVIVDALDNNTGDAKIIQDKAMTILTLNGDLLVGSNEVTKKDETVEALRSGTDLTIRDATSKNIDADRIELANVASGMIVTNGRNVAVGGKSATAATAGEAVTVTDKPLPEIDVDVKVGLEQATFEAVNATLAEGQKLTSKTGTFSIGSEADKKYELAGKLTINEGSSATITGQTTIAKFTDVKAGGTFEAKNGKTTVKENVTSEGTIKLDNATLAANVAGNGTMEVKGISGLKGSATFAHAEVAEGGSVTVTGSLTSDRLIAQGTNNTLAANDTQAYGTGNTVSGTGSIAYGIGHTVAGKNSGAFGDPNLVYADSSYAYGNDNTLGVAGHASDYVNLHVVGNNNAVTGSNTFVLGSGVTTAAKNSVILGNGSAADRDNVVSAGAAGAERQIINVEAGTAATDAATYGQTVGGMDYNTSDGKLTLKNRNGEQIATATISGGGEDTNAVHYDKDTGGVKPNSITLNNGTTAQIAIKNVAAGSGDYDAVNKKQLDEAVAGAGAWTANVDGKSISVNADKPMLTFESGKGITLETDIMSHSIKISAAGGGEDLDAVHYDGAAQDLITLKGAKGTTISNVKAGTLSAESMEAVNGGQLYTELGKKQDKLSATQLNAVNSGITAEKVAQYDGYANAIGTVNDRVSAVQNELNSVSGEVKEVGAISAALAGLHYAEPSGEEGDKFVGAVAYGNYRGESAGAIGVAYKPNPNFMLSASTSVGNSQNAYNAGVSLKFGKGETAVTRAALQKQVKFVNEQNLALKDKNAQLEAENKAQDKAIAALRNDNEAIRKENAEIKEMLKKLVK